MRSKKTLCSRFTLVTFLILYASSVFAQSGSTAGLTGRITDTTGAVLPGVTVTATSLATNQTRTVLSAEDGGYRIPLLEPGAYKVRFSQAGFKTAEVMSVTLTVTETAALDQVLADGFFRSLFRPNGDRVLRPEPGPRSSEAPRSQRRAGSPAQPRRTGARLEQPDSALLRVRE